MIPVAKSYPSDRSAHEFLENLRVQQEEEQERRRQEEERRRQEEERRRQEEERQEERRRRQERRRRRQQYRQEFQQEITRSIIDNRNLFYLDHQCETLSPMRRQAVHDIGFTIRGDRRLDMDIKIFNTGIKLVYDVVIKKRLATGDFYSLKNLRNVRYVTFQKKVIIPDHSKMLSDSTVEMLHFKDEAFIGMSVFSNLSSLRNVYFKKYASISAHAFKNCGELNKVVFDRPTKISMGAFLGCKSPAQIIGDEIEIDYYTYSQLFNSGVSFFYEKLKFLRYQRNRVRI